jgi:hypothetical protein
MEVYSFIVKLSITGGFINVSLSFHKSGPPLMPARVMILPEATIPYDCRQPTLRLPRFTRNPSMKIA